MIDDRRQHRPRAARRSGPAGQRCALLGLLLAVAVPPAAARELDLFDWMGTAPAVVHGVVQRNGGKYVELRAERVIRGELEPGSLFLVHLREANRKIDVGVSPLKLPRGESFLLLLQRAPQRRRVAQLPTFRLVRGIRGAREVPPEGGEALVVAAQELARIQDHKDESRTWRDLRGLLEAANPVLVATSLEHHLKFERGDPALFDVLRPLLSHPRFDLRERAARLIGQIASRHLSEELAGAAELHAELAGLARRDPATDVRVAATRALDQLAYEGTEALLEQIARSDPEQAVRYEAETILLRRRAARTGS